jgi:ATP-dependent helicase HepA
MDDVPVSRQFQPGSIVRLVARPDLQGAVVSQRTIGNAVVVQVFHDGRVHDYFEPQIELSVLPEATPFIPMSRLRAGLTSELLRDARTDYLRARHSGRIDYEPYQFRPVLKLVHADRPRILIADDVGVGKTIEACLIIKELQARQRADRVLVICPKPLIVDEKWRSELRRFDEDFVHLDSRDLRFCIDETLREGEWPARFAKSIVPYSLLDERLLLGDDGSDIRRVGLADLSPLPKFDLVIVDEAHHIRNRSTQAHQCVKRLTDSAEAVVFLTATPLQTDQQDLYTLVNLLRDDLVPSERDFAEMLEPNRHLYEAVEAARAGSAQWQTDVEPALARALATTWGSQVLSVDPRVADVRELLDTSADDKRSRVRVIRLLEDLNTFSSIVTRTRRRDIGDFTVRKPVARIVPLTTEQDAVYREVIRLGRQIIEHQAPGMPVEFLISMLRRQAASSITGLAPMVRQILDGRLDSVDYSAVDADSADGVPPFVGELRAAIEQLGEHAATLQGGPDPKLEVLRVVVEEKQSTANNRVLVFSTFRHTLAYLRDQALTWGVRVGLVDGSVPDAQRHSMRRRFRLERSHSEAIDLMLCSEVGTEGLDYQFCDTLVNYDIPWNPMRIEQRIGRIDRRGQQSESVAIVNILTEGTVEADIYQRCLLRIGVFHRALGGSEEILGSITTQLRRIADDLSLTVDDRQQRLQQLADNEMGRIEEQSQLEEREAGLLGLSAQSFEDRIVEASSPWLEAGRIGELVRAYLEDLLPGRQLSLRPQRIATLRPTSEARERLEIDLAAIGGNPRLERAIRKSSTAMRMTTSQELAADDTEVELLDSTHPLVRMAARHTTLSSTPVTAGRVRSADAAPGVYPIAIYTWTHIDVHDRTALRYVSINPAMEELAPTLLGDATEVDNPIRPTTADEDLLAQRHLDQWRRAHTIHVERVAEASGRRVAALRAQLDRRVRWLEGSVAYAADLKIVKMRESELTGIRDEFSRLIARHDRAASSADVIARHLATVVLEVVAP